MAQLSELGVLLTNHKLLLTEMFVGGWGAEGQPVPSVVAMAAAVEVHSIRTTMLVMAGLDPNDVEGITLALTEKLKGFAHEANAKAEAAAAADRDAAARVQAAASPEAMAAAATAAPAPDESHLPPYARSGGGTA